VEHQKTSGPAPEAVGVHSRAVVLAMGVLYRRIGIKSVDALVGRGVFYGAATTEAPRCEARRSSSSAARTRQAKPRSSSRALQPR